MRTQQQIADTIFDFLNNLIYAPDKAVIQRDELPEEYCDVVEGLLLFGKWLKETRSYATALGNGNMEVKPPGRDNVLAQPIKLLQSNLAHLTWQTQEIAKGDYQQHVDFLGEFSDAFNVMIEQLKDRRNRLIDNIQTIETQNQSLIGMRDFFLNFSDGLLRAFFIFDEDYDIIFCNSAGKKLLRNKPKIYEEIFREIKENNQLHIWEVKLGDQNNNKWYEIERINIDWRGKREIGCLIDDISEKKMIEMVKDKMAFEDQLTGLYNRRYGMEQLQKMLDQKECFSLAFLDLDQLKYINDNFGHSMGDRCLKHMAYIFKRLKWRYVAARIGGDEFMLLVKDTKKSELEEELEQIRNTMQDMHFAGRLYKCSFSYGVVENDKGGDSASLLRKADEIMYKYKFAHRVKGR